MSDTEEESGNVTIDFSHRVSLIRYLGNSMTPVWLRMRAEVFPSTNTEEIDFDITFAKIRFWFETVVARCIVFCHANATAKEMLLTEGGKPKVANHLMMTPFEPTDEHLAVLFQSKMGAFANGHIEFGCVRVEVEGGGLVFTYVGDWRTDLPAMAQWFSTKPYYFETPWWQRDDASTMDILVEPIDPQTPPPWAYRLDFIDSAIRPKTETETETVSDDVVIRGAFRPKIIVSAEEDE